MTVSIIDQAGATVYVDPDTIHRKGDRVTMWELLEYETIQTVTAPYFCRQGCNVNTIVLETSIGLLR